MNGHRFKTFLLTVSLVSLILSLSGAAHRGISATHPQPVLAQYQDPTPAACLFAFEWLHSVRFPLQPDPHAAYSYVAPKLPTDGTPLGFLIEADFPYAVWLSWTVYGTQLQAFSLKSDDDIIPEPGSTNPFRIDNPVFAPSRHYRMLLVPPGAILAPSLAGIPNLLDMPTDIPRFLIAYRVYQAFAGYNMAGSGGPTQTPFPAVYAVNYETGETLDCAQYNGVPPTIGRLPTDTPDVSNLYGTTAAKVSLISEFLAVTRAMRLHLLPAFADYRTMAGWQFAPQIDPKLVTFTRPPLMPGADVSATPPPDQCAGYLGARVDPRRIALIRLPHVASVFETAFLDPETQYPDSEAAYISLTMYGASINTYTPDDPDSASIADSEFQPDETGGSTILVWPRHLPIRERSRLFDYARASRWPLIRGGRTGPLTTANALFRIKRAAPWYYGAYTPSDSRAGVPCYFNDTPKGTRWSEIEKAANPMQYVATFRNLGNAAPQGVHCLGVEDVLSGSCLQRLQAYIESTGGKYFNPGNVPPPVNWLP